MILALKQLNFNDFLNSETELYEFYDFHDSGGEYLDFHFFNDSDIKL